MNNLGKYLEQVRREKSFRFEKPHKKVTYLTHIFETLN